MDGNSSNGHHPEVEPASRPVNPYVDAIAGDRPREIVEYEMDSDPYANMLPGISSIRAARTVSAGVEAGRRGNRLVLFMSLVMLVAIVLPLVLAVISHFLH